MLSAIAALAAIAHAGDYSTWAKYRPVTLSTSGMGLSAAVANYPVSVRFKASAHKDMLDSVGMQVQADGSDIRVTLADGTTDVPFEIEHLSTGDSGRLHLWVLAANVPTNNASAASFRVYWGKTGQTSMSNPATTFPTSAGYQAVFHLNDTGATIKNSANSALNGTATGTSTTLGQNAAQGYVSAKSGLRVRAFGSSNGGESNETAVENFIKISPDAGHILSTHTGAITMEGWIYSSISSNGNTSQGTKHIVAHGAGNIGGKAWFARTAGLDGSTLQNHYSAGGPNNNKGPVAPYAEQHFWQYAVASWNGTNWIIYRQRETDQWNNASVTGPPGMPGDSIQYKIIPGTAPAAGPQPWYIGGASADTVGGDDSVMTRGWQGWMEEVRISTVARDSNYVKLNFLTLRTDSLPGIIHPVSIGDAESPSANGNYASWSGHRTITLNTSAAGANVSGTVTNFPVLIRLGTAEAAIIAAANNGNSIRFSKADNTTALPYQIESWSSTAAAIWVKVDTIKGNNATQAIRMHWGNGAAASESSGPTVFDTTNGFVSVWHMNATAPAASEVDATANGFAATAFGFPGVNNASMIGRGRTFSGTQHMQVLNSAASKMSFSAESSYTFSAWIRSDSISSTSASPGHAIVTKGDHQWALAIYGGTAPNRYYEITTKAGNNGWRQTTTAPTTNPPYAGDTANSSKGVWRFITGSWTATGASTATGRIYMDGVLQKTTNFTGINFAQGRQTARDVHIGVLSNEGTGSTNPTGTLERFFVGTLDEITLSRGLRDSNWVKLSYQNQRETNTLTGMGLPVYTVPGQPTAVTAVADTASAIVSWTAPADNGGKPILSYFATVVGDTLQSCTSTTLSCKLSLSAATPVTIVVRAVNIVGRGANSLASNSVTPISPIVPSKPLNVTATTASSSSVAVGWAAPAYNGGAAVTGYTVTGVPGGTCTTTAMFCVISGLNQGTAYKFTVVATNSAGNGAPSDTVTTTTTGILPGAFVIAMNGSRSPYTYRLPEASVAATQFLSMTISDVQGKRIWTRTIKPAATKVKELTWNGTTSNGRAVAPGLYVVHIKAEMDGKLIDVIQTGIKK